jgi:hypothetical protein
MMDCNAWDLCNDHLAQIEHAITACRLRRRLDPTHEDAERTCENELRGLASSFRLAMKAHGIEPYEAVLPSTIETRMGT